MKKQDLQDGMIVETVEGNRYIVMNDCTCFSRVESYYHTSNLQEDLTHVIPELTINKVYASKNTTLSEMLSYPAKLLWERPTIREYTISQLENILGHPFRIVAEG